MVEGADSTDGAEVAVVPEQVLLALVFALPSNSRPRASHSAHKFKGKRLWSPAALFPASCREELSAHGPRPFFNSSQHYNLRRAARRLRRLTRSAWSSRASRAQQWPELGNWQPCPGAHEAAKPSWLRSRCSGAPPMPPLQPWPTVRTPSAHARPPCQHAVPLLAQVSRAGAGARAGAAGGPGRAAGVPGTV